MKTMIRIPESAWLTEFTATGRDRSGRKCAAIHFLDMGNAWPDDAYASRLPQRIVAVNDNAALSRDERKRTIGELFAEIDVSFEFTDD